MKMTSNLRFLGLIVLLLLTGPMAMAQLGKVSGTLTDNGVELPFTRIQLRQGSTIIAQTQTDENGFYSFGKIEPDQYQLYVRSGEIERTYALVISPSETEKKDLTLTADGDDVIIYGSKEIFTVDPIQFTTITRDEINMMPTTRNTRDLVGSLPGLTQPDHGDPLNLRGGRSGGTVTFIDGQKVHGSDQVPQAAINQVTLINGGVPAEFGDVTGGIILINTYNPGMKGWKGKPLTREEKKAIRLERKRSKQNTQLHDRDIILASAE